MRALKLGIVIAVGLMTLALPASAQPQSDREMWQDLVEYTDAVYGLRIDPGWEYEDFVRVVGFIVGRQSRLIDVDPMRTAIAHNMRVQFETFCFLIGLKEGVHLYRMGIAAMLGDPDSRAEDAIWRLGGHVPPNPPDLVAYMDWSATQPTPSSPPPPGPPPTTSPPTPPSPPAAAPQPGSPLQVVGAGPGVPGTLVLYGHPACTWEVQLIITSGADDWNLASPHYGRTVVGLGEQSGFQVQLYHRGLGQVARLEGAAASSVLVSKGYFESFGDGATEGWVSTAAYDTFVDYGATTPSNTPACSAAPPPPSGAITGAIVIRGVITRSWQTLNHGNRATYDIVWTIPNPTGGDVTLTRGQIHEWQSKVDGSGRHYGGEYVTKPARGFTLAARGQDKSAYPLLPCVQGTCQGTYSAIYEGTDAAGNPVRLILEFP